MSPSEGPSPSIDRVPGTASIALPLFVRRLALALADPPRVSRYVGHLTLVLLLLPVLWNIAPSMIQTPVLGRLAAPQAASSEIGAAYAPASSPDTGRYLEFNAVPLTLRVMRDILPLSAPQRSVRTTVLTYRVQPGDTMLGIAEKFGLKANSLLWANEKLDENPDFLHLDQELNILPVDGAYHTVAAGETLEKIATQYKVEPAAITGFAVNGLAAPYTLKAGQKLIIPGGTKPFVARTVLAYEGPAPQGAKKGTGSFVWPMSGLITQRYWQGHQAADIAGPTGTTIVAADAGFVAVVQYSPYGYGRMIIIDHGNGFQTRYAHLNAVYVSVGQSVGRGTAVGTCGTTGNVTGPHLHFEMMRNGVLLNPFNYLP